jgi:hypothetical protein
MRALIMWRHTKFHEVFLLGAGPAINLSWATYSWYRDLGVPVIVDDHTGMLESCLHQSGLNAATPVREGDGAPVPSTIRDGGE